MGEEEGGGGEGREWGGRQDSPFRIGSLVREERGAEGCLGDSLGDVVLGYPRPGSHAGEPGRSTDCRYRHATRAPAAQGGMVDRDQRV